MKETIQQLKERISPTHQRYIIIGVIGVVFFAVLFFVVSMGDPPKKRISKREDVARELFTGANTRDLGLHGLTAKMQDLTDEMKALRKENENLKNKIQLELNKEVARQEYQESKIRQDAVAMAIKELDKIYGEKIQKLQESAAQAAPPSQETRAHTQGHAPSQPSHSRSQSINGWPRQDDGTAAPVSPYSVDWSKDPDQGKTASSGGGQSTAKTGPSGKKPQFRTIASEDPSQGVAKVAEKQSDDIFIPATSMLSGVLITGMDVPTSDVTRKHPYPAFLRIKKEAILPNRFHADIRECGLLVSGYGELSSHRAMLRSELISCVREDGGVIEVPIDAYATGEDGKAGVRGRLADKRGQLLAKSLMAGFMDSFASVFRNVPVPTLATSAQNTAPFQQVLSADSLQSAGLDGVGGAMQRLADYYIDMSKNIFPILEIDAGRELHFIVSRGVSLKVKGGS